MFKIKYNILVICNVLLGLVNVVGIYRVFGAGSESDVYFLGMTITTTLYLVAHTFIEQFNVDYRRDINDFDKKKRFFSSMLLFSCMAGIIIGGIVYTNLSWVLKLFSSDLELPRYMLLIKVSAIYFICLFFYLPWQVASTAINAEGRIGLAYFSQTIPQAFISFSVIDSVISGGDISAIITAYVVGVFASMCFCLLWCAKNIGFTFKFHWLECRKTILDSIKIKTAHNVHNVFLGWAIAYFSSAFGEGGASLFFYAKKISDTALNVIYIPSHKLLTNKVVDLINSNEWMSISILLKRVSIVFPLIYFFCFSLACVFLPPLLSFLGKTDIDYQALLTITGIMFIANTLITMEVAYGIINQIYVDYKIILISNIGFVFLFLSTMYLSNMLSVGLLSIPLSMAVGQLSNFYFNRLKAKLRIAG